MGLEKNNNGRILYRIARSSLTGNKMYSFFSILTIFISITFVSSLILFLTGERTAKFRTISGMQHVMFMNVSEEQMRLLAEDPRTEIVLPYKFNDAKFETDGLEYSFYYFESSADKLVTYEPKEGRTPEKYDEIVVDRQFMEALGEEASPGAVISLDLNGSLQNFTVCGYTDKGYKLSKHPVYVSRQFAEESPVLGKLPYTALVRLNDGTDMTITEFETVVYQMAADFGISRPDVNVNGYFEEYLGAGNVDLYTLIVVSILVFCAGAVVIYSIFYLSVANRIRQLGQLQTIGMTQRQMKRMIRAEGLLLSGAAIPAGLLVGCLLVYFLQPEGRSLVNYGICAAAVGCLGLLTVQVSIGKPAAIASKVSPVEAARNAGPEREREARSGHRRLTPLRLACLEAGRNRKRWWLTTVSLALGGVIFMCAAAFIASWDEEAYSRQDIFADCEFSVSYLYNAHNNPQPYGPTDLQLTGQLNGELMERLRQIPHVKSVEAKDSVFINIEYQGAFIGQVFAPLTEASMEQINLEAEGKLTYEYMAERDRILVTQSGLAQELHGVTFRPGEKVTLHWFDGEERTGEFEIAAVSEGTLYNDMDATCYMTDRTLKKLWPIMNTTAAFRISAEDYEKNGAAVEQEIRAVLEDYPDLTLLTLRQKKLDDSAYSERLNIQIYAISALIILFSIFNLINTVISSISTRKKELSMLESIGMEERQLGHMLFWESLILALPNILITLTAGVAAGALAVAVIDSVAGYMDYRFPGAAVVLYTAGMVLIPVLISSLCLKGQNRTALVERIGRED